MLGFIATDMYLPAFAQWKSTLQPDQNRSLCLLTVFLGGMALGQLWGLASDKYGHRNTLAVGLVTFHRFIWLSIQYRSMASTDTTLHSS